MQLGALAADDHTVGAVAQEPRSPGAVHSERPAGAPPESRISDGAVRRCGIGDRVDDEGVGQGDPGEAGHGLPDDLGLQPTLRPRRRVLPVAAPALEGDRARGRSPIRAWDQDLHGVGPDEPCLASDRRHPDGHRLAGERVADEEHLPLVPGNAVATVGHRTDLDDELVPDSHSTGYRDDSPAPISPAT